MTTDQDYESGKTPDYPTDRYGEHEYILTDQHINPEMVYPQYDPNGFNVPDMGVGAPPGGPQSPTVEREHPGWYFTRRLPRPSDVSNAWQAQTFQSVASAPPVQILSPNPNRKRLLLWTDAANTGPVFISRRGNGASGTGSSSVALGPGCLPLELTHTGEVFAFGGITGQLLYYIEESYSQS